ncbi:MAG: bifunctional enoyl-CoA hydratase/phosphate acetyltransferase [Planctomycetota bacterium]|jgi:phosphate butyryltransferase
MKSFSELDERAKQFPKVRLAVANAVDASVLEAVVRADANDVADAVLVGKESEICRIADEHSIDISITDIVDAPTDLAAATKAVELVRSGECGVLMKGYLHTDDFLRAILNKEKGLRTRALMSHIFIAEAKGYDRLIFISDGAMNVAPDLEGKAAITLNAIHVAKVFGVDDPKVALLSAVELVNPKIQSTVDAAVLHMMADRHQFDPPAEVEGPFALDNAVSVEAARHKKITGDVAGRADVLIVPSIEAGNMLAKSLVYFAGAKLAGILVGAAAPVVLTSRADSAESKYLSVAAAVLVGQVERHLKLKVGKVRF